MDTARDVDNPNATHLWAERSEQENTSTSDYAVDFVSNGFKQKDDNSSSVTHTNKSGITYIYIAFAETPFKFSTAR